MKIFNKKELPQGKEIPKISDGRTDYETVRIDGIKLKKVKRIMSLYFLTAAMVLLAVLIIWSSGSVSSYALSTRSFLGRGAERIVRFVTKGDFLCFSLSDDSVDTDDKDVSDNVINGGTLPNIKDDLIHTGTSSPNGDNENNKLPPSTKEELYFFDRDLVPKGETAIIPMDLSLSSYGSDYINNSTGYSPDTAKLLAADLKDNINIEYLASSGSPVVLIVHTHATEGYSKDGAISYLDTGGEYARSDDIKNNVVAVGKVLADELNKAGISTIHSTVLHDAVQYKDSYARSEETIRQYLEKYPSIRLVIDLHRDAIVRSNGDLVRPVAFSDGEAAAQVMCVVGSDWGGQKCSNWQGNLALALKLRETLNSKTEGICRPPYLKSSTYNQELSPYSLLLEMGASGNSLAEAKRSAKLVADALSGLIKEL
jgi:stage II sporulation protein P